MKDCPIRKMPSNTLKAGLKSSKNA
jgi:hypothetical protein